MIYEVPEAEAGRRLDAWLAGASGSARNQVQQAIAAGAVRVGGEVVTQPSLKVKAGEAVEYAAAEEPGDAPQAESIPLQVEFEDDDVIVIDKPAGLVVHPAPGHSGGTLVNALLAHCGAGLEGVGGAGRWGIVHRLDALTSGLLVAAKTQPAYEHLVEMLAAREVHRKYLGIALGHFDEPSGTIEGAIARRRSDRKLMGVVDPRRAARFGERGKPARTDWEVLLQGDGVALLGLTLHSGRTHQIRVHMQSIGRPIFGDPEYGWTQARTLHALPAPLRPLVSAAWPGRQMLHAAQLEFAHPLHGADGAGDAEPAQMEQARPLAFNALPPADFFKVLDIFWEPGMARQRIEKWFREEPQAPKAEE